MYNMEGLKEIVAKFVVERIKELGMTVEET